MRPGASGRTLETLEPFASVRSVSKDIWIEQIKREPRMARAAGRLLHERELVVQRDRGMSPSGGEYLDTVLFDDRQKLECRAAGLFRPGFPLLHRAFAGVEITGENRLTDLVPLA